MVGEGCNWEHPRTPSVGCGRGGYRTRLEFLGDTRVGCGVSSGRAGVDEERDEEEVPGSGSEGGGPGPPRAVSFLSFVSFFHFLSICSFFSFLCSASWEQEIGLPQYDPEWLGTGNRSCRIRKAAAVREGSRVENKRQTTTTASMLNRGRQLKPQ